MEKKPPFQSLERLDCPIYSTRMVARLVWADGRQRQEIGRQAGPFRKDLYELPNQISQGQKTAAGETMFVFDTEGCA